MPVKNLLSSSFPPIFPSDVASMLESFIKTCNLYLYNVRISYCIQLASEFTGTSKSKAYNGRWKLISQASKDLTVFMFTVS